MCHRALAFENEFWTIAKDFILNRLDSKDQEQRDWAVQGDAPVSPCTAPLDVLMNWY